MSHEFPIDLRLKFKIQDEVGREFPRASDAVIFARRPAADMRCLETAVRPALAIEAVAENAERIHRERVLA